MRVVVVAAVAKNGVIGVEGDLAWRISDDLKWFKQVTLGKPIIMGRKTYSSIGKPLPGRENIVITRSDDFHAEGVQIARSIEEALAMGLAAAKEADVEEVCVIGGAAIYAQTIKQADRIYLTRVDASPVGDVFFPPIVDDQWEWTDVGGAEAGPRNEYSCEFFILDRPK